MLENRAPLERVLGIFAVCIFVFFIVISVYSLIKFFEVLWYAKFGQRIEYDPEKTPINVLQAMTPIKELDLKKYSNNLAKFIDQKLLIKRISSENDKLKETYQKITEKLVNKG
jgi:hypothetical protein